MTTPVPPVFRTARLFFAGCVSGGVVATGLAIARDLGVPIRPERLLASLLSPPLPPAGMLLFAAAHLAFGTLVGWLARPKRPVPA